MFGVLRSVGISSNPQVRWAAGYRSAPANLSREQLMRGGGYYSKQPAFGGVPRPSPPPDNTAPGQLRPRFIGIAKSFMIPHNVVLEYLCVYFSYLLPQFMCQVAQSGFPACAVSSAYLVQFGWPEHPLSSLTSMSSSQHDDFHDVMIAVIPRPVPSIC